MKSLVSVFLTELVGQTGLIRCRDCCHQQNHWPGTGILTFECFSMCPISPSRCVSSTQSQPLHTAGAQSPFSKWLHPCPHPCRPGSLFSYFSLYFLHLFFFFFFNSFVSSGRQLGVQFTTQHTKVLKLSSQRAGILVCSSLIQFQCQEQCLTHSKHWVDS